MRDILRKLDAFEKRHAAIAFPFAVVKKFGDDQAGNLAAVIAYYGFFSLFPLLLVLVTALGMVLRNNPDLQTRILDSALANFPVIGTEISRNVHALGGSGVTLAVGIALTLWSGLGVIKATQAAMNAVWNIPFEHRPNFLKSTLRALIVLGVLGVLTLASAAAGSVGGGSRQGRLVILGLAVSLTMNLFLFLLAFRILTSENLTWGDVLPGAAVGSVAWTTLQALGGFYVSYQLQGASDVYGTFAVVIGLLAWMFIGAQITLLAAEVNVVRKRRLWPRSLVQPPFTDADVQALTRYAKQEDRRPEERIDVEVDGPRPNAGDSAAH
ncbi:MAG TPA: YihY/virulence factor BrkB family protein [Actinomycetota bacterium]|nr:YihY/virulence factor BrkB family protein [Actinomycetota bacterium]